MIIRRRWSSWKSCTWPGSGKLAELLHVAKIDAAAVVEAVKPLQQREWEEPLLIIQGRLFLLMLEVATGQKPRETSSVG